MSRGESAEIPGRGCWGYLLSETRVFSPKRTIKLQLLVKAQRRDPEQNGALPMKRDLSIHANLSATIGSPERLEPEAVRSVRWAPAVATAGRVSGVLTTSAIKRVLANAEVLCEDVVYEMRLVVGAFRAARANGIEPFSRDFPVIPEVWFRE
jgi:hypothetical protein